MSGYISEVGYYGDTSKEFVEIAVPIGTDVSAYKIEIYGPDGKVYKTFTLGTSVATMNGHDVYVIDSATPGWDSSDQTGNLFQDDAIALVDDSGTALQFISWQGNEVTATEGAAAGMKSTNIGSISQASQTKQSDDGGSTYYTQSSANKGSIPACYARGSLVETACGVHRIETLEPGTLIATADGTFTPLRFLWSRKQTFAHDDHMRPIRLAKGCLGPNVPNRDLVVSWHHRIAIGVDNQLPECATSFVPAHALIDLPGVHVMGARISIKWFHLLCDAHEAIRIHGLVSETLLLGNQMYKRLSRLEQRTVRDVLDLPTLTFGTQRTALPCSQRIATRPIQCSSDRTLASFDRAPVAPDMGPATQMRAPSLP